MIEDRIEGGIEDGGLKEAVVGGVAVQKWARLKAARGHGALARGWRVGDRGW
jgi:hypothetical protein